MTITVFSITRNEVIEVIRHKICMNYAIISPDSKIMAAVGDENAIYFYRLVPRPAKRIYKPFSEKMLMGWEWPLIRRVPLDSFPAGDDRCCFTIAFSPSSHLCAVGSQSGLITVFDVKSMLNSSEDDKDGRDDILCVFQSSRSSREGGAVRCMTFSPRPWDLLVWVEDRGHFGVADIRQTFSRRQVLNLDVKDPNLARVRVERAGPRDLVDPDPEGLFYI